MSGSNRSFNCIVSVAIAQRTVLVFIFLFLAAFLTVPAVAGPEEDMLKSLEVLKKLERSADTKSDFIKLTSKYREIISRFQGKALDPTLAVLHYRLSRILLDEVGNSEMGLSELTRIVELYPDSPEAAQAMGALYRLFDSAVPEATTRITGVSRPGYFADPESGIGFSYDPVVWKFSGGSMPSGTLIDLASVDGSLKRRLSVICNNSADMSTVAFASAFVDEMRKIPGVSSVVDLSSRRLFLGNLPAMVSKLKVMSNEGSSILLQAILRVRERTLCIVMMDDFSNTVAAVIDFNAILDSVGVR